MRTQGEDVLRAIVAVLLAGVLATGAMAQPLPKGVRPSSALKQVDGGVFELRGGQSVDLTDRKLLLSVEDEDVRDQNRPHHFNVYVGGARRQVSPGTRIDLAHGDQRRRGGNATPCFLDVVDYIAPKGAPATAKFRLSC